jgi:hypothetical protein
MTFTNTGEDQLSKWMGENAHVGWLEHDEPWTVEDDAIGEKSLPLNLRGNESHPFYPILTDIRREAREKARSLPIVNE